MTFPLISAFMLGAIVNSALVIGFTWFQDQKKRHVPRRDFSPKFTRMSYHQKH